ncbi:MAG: hypothetical protein K2N63_16965, partial [Lachnospiraceae bacterium]|nr:hypothetical protein [Lachnospiraceae bacterium]
MLYIVTALYEEALPFLKKYNLKRKPDFPHFDLFTGEGVLLLITRKGALRAATAVSSLLTAYPPGRQDLLLSAGCAGCAVKETLGKAFLLCRITEGSSLRTRYPELLYRCPFPIAEVITLPTVCTKAPIPDTGDFADSLPRLFDMEAAGVYEAAIPYFSCDRLLFIKVVSDALTGLSELSDTDRRRRVTDCIKNILPILSEWLNQLTCAFSPEEGSQKIAAFLSSSSSSP